jgi:hypothetical protein
LRSAVAFKRQHHRQVGAEVVLRKAVAQRQVTLHVSACDAAYQLYLCLVVEIDVCQFAVERMGELATVGESVAVFPCGDI